MKYKPIFGYQLINITQYITFKGNKKHFTPKNYFNDKKLPKWSNCIQRVILDQKSEVVQKWITIKSSIYS